MSRGGQKTTYGAVFGCNYSRNDESEDFQNSTVAVPSTLDARVGGATGAGDIYLLCHVTEALGASVSTPTNPVPGANPWEFIFDQSQQGRPNEGAIRLRIWRKLSIESEYSAPPSFSTTQSSSASGGLVLFIVPWGAYDPSIWPLTLSPVRKVNYGAQHYCPEITTPNRTGLFRDMGTLMGIGAGWVEINAEDVWVLSNGSQADYFAYNVDHFYAGGLFSSPSSRPIYTDATAYYSRQKLDGGLSIRPNYYPGSTNDHLINMPWVSTTALVIPYLYPGSTPGVAWDDLADSFETNGPVDTDRYHVTGSPTVVDQQLVLDAGEKIITKSRADFASRTCVLEVVDHTPTAANTLTLAVGFGDDPRRFNVVMRTGSGANGPAVRATVVDDGFAVHEREMTLWGPHCRWWRLREDRGVILFEASPDKLTWRSYTTYAHPLLADQLASCSITVAATGATAVVDNLNAPVVVVDQSIPFESTYAFMNATPELRALLPGNDCLIGIADQNSTQAVRDAQGTTLVRRTWLLSEDPATTRGTEIFMHAVHGCLVSACAVPPGGRYVEADVFGGNDFTSATMLMAGVMWCARQGAKVINLSAGGGADEPVFAATFGYLYAVYDVLVTIAAGNSFNYGLDVPAAYSTVFSNVLSVGAFDEYTGTRAIFSSHHEYMTGVAPGEHTGGRLPSGVGCTWRGTSAAAPHAANLLARLLSGGVHTPAKAGGALKRHTRKTGQPRADEGGGAFDLTLAWAGIDDPVGTRNVPEVAMPRFFNGQVDGVASGFNTMVDTVEDQGLACHAYWDAGFHYAQLATGTAGGVLGWDAVTADSYGGMWTPDTPEIITAPADGRYLAVLHVRFGTLQPDGTHVLTGAYATGNRKAAILLNGDDPEANTIAHTTDTTFADTEGQTLTVSRELAMFKGDWIYGHISQTSGGTILCCQGDYGGTSLSLTMVAPLAPTLAAPADPVTDLSAVADSFRQITLSWTPPAEYDQVLIRRLPGSTAPAGVGDGTFIVQKTGPTTGHVDTFGVEGSTTYSYAVFARRGASYAPRAITTVTTPIAPPAPLPVNDLVATTPTSMSVKLTWTLPSGGPTRAGIRVRRFEGVTTPTGPEGGVPVADLAPDATTITVSNLLTDSTWSFGVWTYRVEQVFSPVRSVSRKLPRDITIYGPNIPGTTSSNVNPPNVTRTDGPALVGVQFHVKAPALLKGIRFWRHHSAIGNGVVGAVWKHNQENVPGQGMTLVNEKLTPDLYFGNNGVPKWEEVYIDPFIPLLPNVNYKVGIRFPVAWPQYHPYFVAPGFAPLGLGDDFLRVPGSGPESQLPTGGIGQNIYGEPGPGPGMPPGANNTTPYPPYINSGGATWYVDVILNKENP